MVLRLAAPTKAAVLPLHSAKHSTWHTRTHHRNVLHQARYTQRACNTAYVHSSSDGQRCGVPCRWMSSEKQSISADNKIADARLKATADKMTSEQEHRNATIFGTISTELRYINEYLNKNKRSGAGHTKIYRTLAELDALTLEQLKARAAAQQAAKQQRTSGVEQSDAGESSVADGDAPRELLVVEHDTVWDKRIDALNASLRSGVLAQAYRSLRRSVLSSESPVIKSVRQQKQELSEALEDVREVYETSQDPRINRLRRTVDMVSGESEHAYALAELKKVDPTFNQLEFIEQMQDYMIPAVVSAYRRGTERDQLILGSVVSETAEAVVQASFKERAVQQCIWDPRILDIRQVEIKDIVIKNNVPHIQLIFVCQHIHCTRHIKTNKIIDGNDSNIVNEFYYWELVRDFENDLFDWQISAFQTSRIYALV